MVKISYRQRAGIGLRAVRSFVVLVLLLLAVPVMLAWPLVATLWLLGAALLLAVPLASIWRIFSRRRLLALFPRATLATTLLLVAVVAAPPYVMSLMAEWRPLMAPRATLSDGTKTVVFQGMTPLATEAFFASVQRDMDRALSEGYTIFHEGVVPSPDEPGADEWYAQTLALAAPDPRQTRLAAACGLSFREPIPPELDRQIAARPLRHLRADADTAALRGEYDRLLASDEAFGATLKQARLDEADWNLQAGVSALLAYVDQATEGQREKLQPLCLGVVTLALSAHAADPMDPVLLDYRSRHLAERIATHPFSRIHVVYDHRHLAGLVEALQARDPAWAITSVTWAAPLHLTVQPPLWAWAETLWTPLPRGG